ncbi:hypothetical protein [Aquimarina mytili]|uniref:Uncharacterized protein n=1 Tax=Aquimarina mytili TaxID=874423 RepID=A0A937D7B2_9FLAO|nr:hypothetical protein [Aquimarina mytili]MBL0682915.1 hypothetical protein [Aquimarina mytili]
MKTKLKISIDNLYTVFKKYCVDSTKLRASSCPCCVTDEEIKEIVGKPLERLSEEELGHFSRSAISTFGTIEDYKHFLPRILECMQYPNTDLLFDFTCFEKLNYAEWETWPFEEQKAIESYFETLWCTVINDENTTGDQVEGVMSIILKYGYLDRALLEWSKSNTSKSTFCIIEGILNGFNFEVNDNDYDIMFKWLTSHTIKSKIEDMYFKTNDKELANKIAIVYTILENKWEVTFY